MKTTNLVYVSGALSDVPAEVREFYLQFYEDIARVIEQKGLSPYVPHWNTDPVRHKNVTPKQVDLIDRQAVTSAMLMVAVADNPSLGVGIEVEMAFHSAKPVILICERGRLEQRRISRLIRGNPSVVGEIVYDEPAQALDQLGQFLDRFLAEQAENILPEILKP